MSMGFMPEINSCYAMLCYAIAKVNVSSHYILITDYINYITDKHKTTQTTPRE